ncbi:MAG: Asp-tRNA(Asn)/Glu-tRNA(Gln) amidotransferase subunit GatC [Oscillospiraceae bacterium]
MNTDTLQKLEKLNQLCLTEAEKSTVTAFFDQQADLFSCLEQINTENIARMVHVMPILTVVREDREIKLFTRDALQESAPETHDGYWQVPRLIE